MKRAEQQRLGSALLAALLAPLPATGRVALVLHELGHAAAALGTGGRLRALNLGADGSGQTAISGGNPVLILALGPLIPMLSLALIGARLWRSPSPLAPYPAGLALVFQLRLVLDLLLHGLLRPGPQADSTRLATLWGLPAPLVGLALGLLGLLTLLPVAQALRPRPFSDR